MNWPGPTKEAKLLSAVFVMRNLRTDCQRKSFTLKSALIFFILAVLTFKAIFGQIVIAPSVDLAVDKSTYRV